jgi:hypothetical protein
MYYSAYIDGNSFENDSVTRYRSIVLYVFDLLDGIRTYFDVKSPTQRKHTRQDAGYVDNFMPHIPRFVQDAGYVDNFLPHIPRFLQDAGYVDNFLPHIPRFLQDAEFAYHSKIRFLLYLYLKMYTCIPF